MELRTEAGKLKAIAVTSVKRLANLPDVPTVAETLPGYEMNSWWGMRGPARIPKDIVNRLNTEIVKVLNSPDVKKRLLALNAEVSGNSPEEFAGYQNSEMAKLAKLVKSLGLQAAIGGKLPAIMITLAVGSSPQVIGRSTGCRLPARAQAGLVS